MHSEWIRLSSVCVPFKMTVGGPGNSGWIIVLPDTDYYKHQPEPLKSLSMTRNRIVSQFCHWAAGCTLAYIFCRVKLPASHLALQSHGVPFTLSSG